MIQEYIAFGAFLTAIIIATISIIRFIIDQVTHKDEKGCSSNCNCKPESTRKLTAKTLTIRNNHFKSVKLK